jgi:hypothetical protein
VLGKLFKYFHHLGNPHCHECALEKRCANCDTLSQLLADEVRKNKDLLDRLLYVPAQEVQNNEKVDIKALRPSWNSIRSTLELKDREAARNKTVDEQILAGKQTVEKLEKELEIPNG